LDFGGWGRAGRGERRLGISTRLELEVVVGDDDVVAVAGTAYLAAV